ncbi:MAG: sodium:proton antiporter [Candidatus Methylumidiphilus alinenensis]|uniref:Sodium:proton antiporter n=1 Tax=Candidatus Methylumidiphilus alinenensis TaxID=2202197 RepID=A0A2W4QN43_9GAMM|nr:MAG: sodium:proton antiporter [Candidatus Methylumidiphilus alinenensis]
MTNNLRYLVGIIAGLPVSAFAENLVASQPPDLIHHWAGYFSLAVIVVAYVSAMLEDLTMLRKSKSMVLGGTLVWFAILLAYRQHGDVHPAVEAFKSNLQSYMELLLFIMASMTYLNAMEDMHVFDALRNWLVGARFGYRKLFWITGILVFFLSTIINGLTAGLLMGAVVLAVGKGNPRFISLACINIVVATNAGGSLSPLGGISTLFVWQKGLVGFTQFFTLFIPCLVNFLVPAIAMSFAIPKVCPLLETQNITLQRGAVGVVFLFAVTIALAIAFDMVLRLPPAAGMMAGLSFLQLYSFYLKSTEPPNGNGFAQSLAFEDEPGVGREILAPYSYDIFEKVGRLEWDTLLFFYGAMMGIGGLGFIGYLDAVSQWLYGQHDPTEANVLIGLSSAMVDNGTLMFAVLSMHPGISQGQWLLLTLTLGVGGSLMAIGSAPGIGLLGLTKGQYSFLGHLKWFPVILIGYFAAIGVHFLVNARFF